MASDDEYHFNNFTIKKTLTEVDVQPGNDYIMLSKEEVEEHIFKYWSHENINTTKFEGMNFFAKDVDTNTDHIVKLRYYNGNPCTYGLSLVNFIERRSLRAGDMIGFYWNLNSISPVSRLCFGVLMKKFI